MAWAYANTGEIYTGPTHTLGANVYSGGTRTPDSRRLIEIADPPKPKTAAEKRKERPSTIIVE